MLTLECASAACMNCSTDVMLCEQCRYGEYLYQQQCGNGCRSSPLLSDGNITAAYGVVGRVCAGMYHDLHSYFFLPLYVGKYLYLRIFGVFSPF